MRARRRSRSDAAALGREFAELLSPLIELGEVDLRRGLQLFERHPDLGCFDAVLAAAAMDRQADALLSADPAFRPVPHLPHLCPASPELAARLP